VNIRRRDECVARDSQPEQNLAIEIELRPDLDSELLQTEKSLLRERPCDHNTRCVASLVQICGFQRSFGQRACEDDDGISLCDRILWGQKFAQVNKNIAPDSNEGQQDEKENA
jgi:hypothetical protein